MSHGPRSVAVASCGPVLLHGRPGGDARGLARRPHVAGGRAAPEDGHVVVLPFGPAAKAHGPHLPMNADAKVADYLCARAVEAQNVVVAPPIAHGWLPPFRQLPGTEVGDSAVFIRYVDEVAHSLIRSGARRLVFLNTSISKAGGLPLSIVARDLRERKGIPTLVVSWDDLETRADHALQTQPQGTHAEEIETSIHLFLQPGLVQMDKAVTDYGRDRPKDYPGYRPGLFSRDPRIPPTRRRESSAIPGAPPPRRAGRPWPS